MGIWPFRRRSIRKNIRSGARSPQFEGAMHDAGSQSDPGRHNGGELSAAVPERRKSRRDKKRKSSRESKKLQRDPRRTYSFSPGRNDSIRVTRDQDRPPVPPLPSNFKGPANRAQTEKIESSQVGEKPTRAVTQPQESAQVWARMPTLHKRSAQEMARRKSSKKRKEEHDREAEIKSMAAFMPTRPAADPNSSGRSLKRENRKVRNGLNTESSDISLPLAESIHSSLSGSEHQTSFKLSAFDMLAPRPTIRYSEAPRYGPGPHGFGIEGSDSKKRRTSERIPVETLKAHKRIDDLADDLNAGELRELMERDQKRREQKKIADRLKAERRLTRRQEKQKADEATAAREGTPPPDNMERGVLGRDVVGLGIGTSAFVTTSRRKSSTGSESGRTKPQVEASQHDSAASNPQNPFADFHRSASLVTEEITPSSEHSDPIIETAKVGTMAKASVSPPASPRGHARGQSSISQMIDLGRVETEKPRQPEEPPNPQPTAESIDSSTKPQSSWTSFFKRSSKTKRGSTPSSFSNTSRDSMHNGQGPQIGYTPMRSTSNIPKRTMSKFREDLPELPISPPDSRVQSPEAEVVPPIRTTNLERRTDDPPPEEASRVRYDTPTGGYRSLDAMRFRNETPTSEHRSNESPEPVLLSQSLASIDSEGSWLSGRRGGSKRGSAQNTSYPMRDSANSLQKRFKEYSESTEELGIAEDEYFSRLSPEPDTENRIRRPSGAPMPSSDEEDGNLASPVGSESAQTKWGAVARHPTVVHREPSARSREGLLNEFEDDSENENVPQDITNKSRRRSYGFDKSVIEEAEPGVTLNRATSIDLGRGHVRRISAGSARLLDVKPRASQDTKRLSSG